MANGKWQMQMQRKSRGTPRDLPAIFHRPCSRGGFSFAEVMFAVVILGIGFIMVAAIFPVAIQQTQITGEESTAAAAAREAVSALSKAPSSVPFTLTTAGLQNKGPSGFTPLVAIAPGGYLPTSLFPCTSKMFGVLPTAPVVPADSQVAPFCGARWEAVRGNLILPSDERTAWVPLYRRANRSNVVQLIVFPVQVRNRSRYDRETDLLAPPAQALTGPSSPVNATTTHPPAPGGTPDTINVSGLPGVMPQEGWEGWCVRVQSTGRVYRLGRQIGANTSTNFELAAPDDLRLAPGPDGLWGTNDDYYDKPVASAQVDLLPPTTFQPRVCRVRLLLDTGLAAEAIAGRITFYNPTGIGQPLGPPPVPNGGGTLIQPAVLDNQWQQPEAAPGAYIVIFDDMATDQPSPYVHLAGRGNGRVYQLGTPINAAAGEWNLSLAVGMKSAAENLPRQTVGGPENPNVNHDPLPRAFIIGAGLTTPGDLYNGLGAGANGKVQTSGAAQDISYFTTFISVP